ncbi:hypothetical protein KSS87_023620 [Heliosperma pusillum]|nr:hypothetical protein KSS87_023620 [Heliosperma pusillum]
MDRDGNEGSNAVVDLDTRIIPEPTCLQRDSYLNINILKLLFIVQLQSSSSYHISANSRLIQKTRPIWIGMAMRAVTPLWTWIQELFRNRRVYREIRI